MGHTRRYNLREVDWYNVEKQERSIGASCVYVTNCPIHVPETLGWGPTVTSIFKIFSCSVIFFNYGKCVQFSFPQISDVLLPKENYELQDRAVRLSQITLSRIKSLFLLSPSRLMKYGPWFTNSLLFYGLFYPHT